jgi:hypothetical protein
LTLIWKSQHRIASVPFSSQPSQPLPIGSPFFLELCPFPSRPNLRDLRNAQSHIPGSRDKPGNGYRM